MLAAIYARKSTDQNGVADEQRSVTRQIEHAAVYARRRGWTVADEHVYSDDGISGAEFAARPGFLRLMNALKPRPAFDVLIMSEESRLGREAIETAYALKQIIQAGVRVFFYLEDRERTLETPTDKLLLSVTAFADELEREKAAQRVYDAMQRKARAGHVTGGRVFGYDNVPILLTGPDGKPQRSHVERRINPAEAEVIRRIFEMAADGFGKRRIAATLNEAGAPAPKPQRGRPGGWAPSSVFEVLARPLYRGEVIWNATKKRDRWGQHRQHARPEAEWVRLPAPDLQIVPADLWERAQRRMAESRARYLGGTQGRRWGRPAGHYASKYLLVGLAACQDCGGGLLVKTRDHGRKRAYRYGCSSHHLRGRAVCANGLEAMMAEADQLVINAVRQDVLDPEVIGEACDLMLAELEREADGAARRRQLEQEIARTETEIARLADAVAAGGDLAGLLVALKGREARRVALVSELATAPPPRPVPSARALRREVDERVTVWRDLMTENPAEARIVLSQVLDGRVGFEPHPEAERPYYRVVGRTAFARIFEGICCSSSVASPAGVEPAFRP